MVTSIDSNLLLNFYNARIGTSAGRAVSLGSTAAKKSAPTAPWTKEPTAAEATAAVKAALSGRKLINEGLAKLDVAGASDDYRKLFAMYQGLTTMGGLVDQIQKKGISSVEADKIKATFAKGLNEVLTYAKGVDFEKVRLTTGEVASTAKTTAPIAVSKQEYTTGVLFEGSSSEAVPRFAGDVRFNITVKRGGDVYDVPIDLNELGGDDQRTMANVVNLINDKLQAAGVDTRFATQRTPGADRTTKIDGKDVKLGPGPDQFSFKVKPNGETVTFSAPVTASAVYMTQQVGDPDPDTNSKTEDSTVAQQLIKFQDDSAGVPDAIAAPGEANFVDGRTFAKTLGAEVKTVRASKVAPDGSVYMLADVTSKTGGQELRGSQDVALLKYDAAGNLLYTRTLGASDTASGLGLAVAADGRIAIAGSITGRLNGAQEGALNSGATGSFAKESDSFVTVFNADGEEMWTQRRGARMADEASQIVFGPDDMVYVAGRSKSALPGTTSIGGYDGYIEGFGPPDPDAPEELRGKIPATFTQSFGTAGDDKPAGMVLDGNYLVTASVEDGRGVLRRFDISSGSPVLASTRDLGDLQAGDITGLALDGSDVIVVGTSSNGALNAGTVTRALAGGTDAFAARIPSDLSAGGQIAYYGGSGDDKATAMSVVNGEVWIAGSAGTDLPDQDPVGDKDGFLTRLDIGTGDIEYSKRFTGRNGNAAPTSIAVDPSGASALDRLGLPNGKLVLKDSAQIIAGTTIRPGDNFTVKFGTGRPQTITIDANETLDTLAQKIRRASGFQAKISVGTGEGGSRKLSVSPLNPRNVIEFGAGKVDKDALEQLGIEEGVVRTNVINKKTGLSAPADGKGQIFGLGLETDLNLNNKVEIAHAAADIATALGVIRKAYKELVSPATSAAVEAKKNSSASGPVPAYLTNQLANYQAALARLGG